MATTALSPTPTFVLNDCFRLAYVCTEVRHRHPIQRLPQRHGGLALVPAIAPDPATGRLPGGGDTGSGGMALSV